MCVAGQAGASEVKGVGWEGLPRGGQGLDGPSEVGGSKRHGSAGLRDGEGPRMLSPEAETLSRGSREHEGVRSQPALIEGRLCEGQSVSSTEGQKER